MAFPFQRLFRSIARITGDALPWGMELYNPESGAWEPIGNAIGPTGVLYEVREGTVEFVLTTDGNLIAT